MTRNLNLWPIGNCQASALVDDQARFVWACLPRVDGEPLFPALIDDTPFEDALAGGFWGIDLEGCVSVSQRYMRNSPVLITRKTDASGSAVDIIDFAPRYRRTGRTYRPNAFIRIVRTVSGSPRIRVRLRPSSGWNIEKVARSYGSNHISYDIDAMAMRLSTNAPIGPVGQESAFRVEKDLYFFLGPDESFTAAIEPELEKMLDDTLTEWRGWVRGLATPPEYQEAVIRAAITLKLCQHEDTGAIVAALTTSIPEHADSGRNWDYRYCWVRDAYYTVEALNRIGALDVLESYLEYLRNIVDGSATGDVQPLYDVRGNARLEESEAGRARRLSRHGAGARGQRGVHAETARRLRADRAELGTGVHRPPADAHVRRGGFRKPRKGRRPRVRAVRPARRRIVGAAHQIPCPHL